LKLKFTRKENRPGAVEHRGGKAPLLSRALVQTLLITPFISLLILSFQPLSSPALAAGEVAPSFGEVALSFIWPARGEVVNPFQPAQGPYGSGGHSGIDISLAPGSEVRASAPGTVCFAGGTPLGPCVSIAHKGGLKTTYVSLGVIAVRRGQEVGQGQVVGESDGSKDRSSTSPHLHFGLFLNGTAIDPLPLLEGRLLNPEECLFLGPWDDRGAIDAYLERHNQGGFFNWLGGGIKSVSKAMGGAVKSAAGAAGKALATAWRCTCRVAGAVGRGFQAFYRRCVQPWLSPLCRGVAEVAKKIWSNRYVQALMAGLAAAALICLAVAGVALAFGISLVTAVVAAIIGSVAAIGYALYYAFTSGDSFSFATCFFSSLIVGGAAALSSLCFSYIAPLIGAGWSQLGWLGFGKAFLINGAVDSVAYITFCLATGREVSPLGVLSTFLVGGLLGGAGKLFMSGLFAEGTVQALAASFLSSGGGLLSGEAVTGLTAYALAFAINFTYKAVYVLFCGCSGFLADVIIRISTGGIPNVLESVLSFTGGALAGGLGLAWGGEGGSGLLARLSGGRLKISSDLAKTAVGKLFSRSLKESFSALIHKLKRKKKRLEEGLWWSEIGGEF
jgi:Peptidase family M23